VAYGLSRFLALLPACLGPLASGQADDVAGAPVDASAVKSSLVARIHKIADSGQLGEASAVGAMLDLAFEATVEDKNLPGNCNDPGELRSIKTTRYKVRGPNWYRRSAAELKDMNVPAFAINPATVVGEPALKYETLRSAACTDRFRLQDHAETHLTFRNLSSYVCLSPGDVRKLLPSASFVPGTDGVSLIRYDGAVDGRAGTTVEFWFRAGAPCALSAEIEEDDLAGFRYRRAELKYLACAGPAIRSYCGSHPPIAWSDSEAVDAMMKHADKTCGTVDALYKKEPAEGDPPPGAIVRRGHPTPCEGW
jgi:hypothetical protein